MLDELFQAGPVAGLGEAVPQPLGRQPAARAAGKAGIAVRDQGTGSGQHVPDGIGVGAAHAISEGHDTNPGRRSQNGCAVRRMSGSGQLAFRSRAGQARRALVLGGNKSARSLQ